jgi:hypothetical protein
MQNERCPRALYFDKQNASTVEVAPCSRNSLGLRYPRNPRPLAIFPRQSHEHRPKRKLSEFRALRKIAQISAGRFYEV